MVTINKKFEKFSSDVGNATVPLNSKIEELSSELGKLKLDKDKSIYELANLTEKLENANNDRTEQLLNNCDLKHNVVNQNIESIDAKIFLKENSPHLASPYMNRNSPVRETSEIHRKDANSMMQREYNNIRYSEDSKTDERERDYLLKNMPPTSEWPKFSGEGEYDFNEIIEFIDDLFVNIPNFPNYAVTRKLGMIFTKVALLWYNDSRKNNSKQRRVW